MGRRAKAKLAVEISQDIGDKTSEGRSLILVATTRLPDNKDEAVRLAKLAEKLIKEGGDSDLVKEAGDSLDFIREWDPKKKEKEEASRQLAAESQSPKTDYTRD